MHDARSKDTGKTSFFFTRLIRNRADYDSSSHRPKRVLAEPKQTELKREILPKLRPNRTEAAHARKCPVATVLHQLFLDYAVPMQWLCNGYAVLAVDAANFARQFRFFLQ